MKTQRSRRFLSIAAMAALMIPASAVMAQSAQAAPATPTIRWVSPQPTVAGPGTSCTRPGYNLIQDAVNASVSGDTIKVCPGTYTEQVTITGLTLKLLNAGVQPVIQAPASPAGSSCNPSPINSGVTNRDIVDLCGGANVSMTGIAVQGPIGALDCSTDGMGIAVVGGSTLNATNVAVNSIRQNPLNGCQGGIGILVGRASTSQVGTATLKGVSVTDYQKGGIEVSNTGSSATISGSTVSTSPTDQIAANGIEVVDNAKAKISTTSVSGNECNVPVCGPNAETQTQSTGILLIDPAVGSTFATLTLSGNDIGFYNFEDTLVKPTFTNSTVSGNRDEGVVLDQGNITMTGNAISGSPYGVQAISYVGQTQRPAGTMLSETFTSNTTAAVSAVTDGGADSFLPKLVVNKSSIDTSNGYGVQNQTGDTAIINAKSNWWGDASGPSDWSFGSGAQASANVDFFPWATMANYTTFRMCDALANPNLIWNTPGPAVLCGTGGNNYIQQNASGPTLILGNGGNDHLVGGPGNDYIIGGPGNDVLDAGATGVDSLQGRGGTDSCIVHTGDRTSDC